MERSLVTPCARSKLVLQTNPSSQSPLHACQQPGAVTFRTNLIHLNAAPLPDRMLHLASTSGSHSVLISWSGFWGQRICPGCALRLFLRVLTPGSQAQRVPPQSLWGVRTRELTFSIRQECLCASSGFPYGIKLELLWSSKRKREPVYGSGFKILAHTNRRKSHD